jgi:Flp pilus assembly protein TadD
MFGSLSKTTNLREQLQKALRAKRLGEALDIYALIEQRRPDEPRWPHRRGDLLQRMGRAAEAVLAYEHAVELYAAKGFVARAEAMTTVASAVQPASCGSPRHTN